MNKKEAIKLICEMAQESFKLAKTHAIHVDSVVDVISQIDEPQKVVVPKFVADNIEYCKREEFDLYNVLDYFYQYNDSANWLDVHEEVLALAWFYGYEVEKEQEPLYVVEIPDPNAEGYSIVLGRKEGKVCIKQTLSTTWEMNCSNQLTEAEIKQDFDWAWDAGFAKPVKVKEVE